MVHETAADLTALQRLLVASRSENEVTTRMNQVSQRPRRRPVWPILGVASSLVAALSLAACGAAAPTTSGASTRANSLLFEGLTAERLGHLAQADADYLGVLRIDRSNVYAWYNLGLIAQHRGDASGAANDYRQAVLANRRYVPALFNLATIEAATDPAAAVLTYEQVIKLSPADAAAHFNLGLALESIGREAQGRSEITHALKLDPRLAHGAQAAPANRS